MATARTITIKLKDNSDWRYAAVVAICAINNMKLSPQHKEVLEAAIVHTNGSFRMIDRHLIAQELNIRLDYLTTTISQLRKLQLIVNDEVNPTIFNKNHEGGPKGVLTFNFA